MRFLLVLIAFLASPVFAQEVAYPSATSATINDMADVLPEETKTRLSEALRTLSREKGVALVVVTIDSRADYGDTDSLEEFATGLFNDWGIGNSERSDGILLLAAIDDRELQIVLGEGYPSVYDWLTDDILAETVLPMMQAGQISEGIESGAYAIRDRIAVPFAEGREPERPTGQTAASTPAGSGSSGSAWPWLAGLGVIIVGLFAIGPISRARRVCPDCGKRGGITTTRETVTEPSDTAEGLARVTETCSHCGKSHSREVPLPKAAKAKVEMGGGKSSGGGSGGSW